MMKKKNKDNDLISKKDIIEQLAYSSGSSLFLGKYTIKELYSLIDRVGLVERAKKFGFSKLKVDLESSDVSTQRLSIYDGDKKRDRLIMDLLIKIENFEPADELKIFFGNKRLKFLVFEWLTLQNPNGTFSEERKRLPGQKYPGLGIKKELYIIFRTLARELNIDGILAKPQFYHNAMMFSGYFKFLHPEKEGEFIAISEKYLERLGFSGLSWAVYENCLSYGLFRRTYNWKYEPQIFALKKRVVDYFDNKKYKEKVIKSKNWWLKKLKLKKSKTSKILNSLDEKTN